MTSSRILLSNVRFALRLMRRSPSFYALVLILLAAGIGATTAMFSVAESVLLKPLPYEDAGDLTDIARILPEGIGPYASPADFIDWRAQGASFEQMAGVTTARFNLSSEGTLPVGVDLAEVTADFFPMFRTKPLVGRLLGASDDRPGVPLVAVISERLWQTRFGSDPSIVGRTITLNSRPYTIVGVAPRGFAFASRHYPHVDVWKPYFGSRSSSQVEEAISNDSRGLGELAVIGRRRHGVSLAEAQAQMTTVAKNLELAHPDTNSKIGIGLCDLHEALVGARGRQIWLLFAAVGLVFVVISANIASLLLARAQGRRGEYATRAALGAPSSALVVQVVTETAVLFGIGSLLGAAAASALVGRIAGELLGGTGIEGAVPVHTDVAALLAGVGASLLVGLAAGLGPALVTLRVDPASVLKQASGRAGAHRSQAIVRALLVVTQLAVAFALLTGSALAVKAFVRLASTPPGFDPDDLATAVVSLPARTYDSKEKIEAFFARAIQEMGDLPGVESASGTTSLPMSDSARGLNFTIEGRPPWPSDEAPVLGLNYVAPGYFHTMRIPIVRGRSLTREDTATSRPVVILGQHTVDRFFAGEDPIGRRIGYGDAGAEGFAWLEIVGVAGDVRKEGLAMPSYAEAYTPFAQTPDSTMFLVARTRTPEAVLAALPRLVQRLDPEVAVSGLERMTTRVAGSIGESHQMAVMLGAFAIAALVLATLGLFGLVSYTTAERTRELGIRLALGTPPASVVGLVVKGAMKLVAIGLAVGLLLSVWVAREIAAIMPGAAAFDLAVVAPIPVILGLAGLLACVLPALRAVRTPPASALRYE